MQYSLEDNIELNEILSVFGLKDEVPKTLKPHDVMSFLMFLAKDEVINSCSFENLDDYLNKQQHTLVTIYLYEENLNYFAKDIITKIISGASSLKRKIELVGLLLETQPDLQMTFQNVNRDSLGEDVRVIEEANLTKIECLLNEFFVVKTDLEHAVEFIVSSKKLVTKEDLKTSDGQLVLLADLRLKNIRERVANKFRNKIKQLEI